MESINSVSTTEIRDRRQKLQRRRQLRFLQALWRSLLAMSLAGGLVWAIALSRWTIERPEQITIEGNQRLSTQALRALVPLSSPVYLLQLDPQQLQTSLELNAPLAQVSVSRRLLPPGLTITVQERDPVALTLPSSKKQPQEKAALPSSPSTEVGLLDATGIWMPKSSYINPEANFDPPKLRVIGYQVHHRLHWQKIYSGISRSTVEISLIDWQDPTNLILETQLGQVHLGSDLSQFLEQLTVLARLRRLPSQINPNQIDYIDLKNPKAPSIRLKTKAVAHPLR